MKKKRLWMIGICFVSLVLIVSFLRYKEIQKLENDPNWRIAKEIYKVQNALHEVDEGYKFQSVSKVTPFTYADSKGNTIVYYCCQTAYLDNASVEYTGLNMDAIGRVVDLDLIENKQECKVNGHAAFMCELEGLSYLCWTLSPNLSCVLAYAKGTIDEASIFEIAESVEAP